MKAPQPRFHTTARISRSVSWIFIPGPVVGLFEFLFMATATSSAGRYTPTGAGFINPNFPNPQGPHDARIIIYGCVGPTKISRRISPKAETEIKLTHILQKLHTLLRTLYRRHSAFRHQHYRASVPSIPVSCLDFRAHNLRLPARNNRLHIPHAFLSKRPV